MVFCTNVEIEKSDRKKWTFDNLEKVDFRYNEEVEEKRFDTFHP